MCGHLICPLRAWVLSSVSCTTLILEHALYLDAQSIMLSEYMGEEEKSIFIMSLPRLCGTGFINYIEPRAQRNQHSTCWVLTKCRSSEGHRHPCPCPLVMHLSQGRARSGTGWLYSQDRSHSVNCTTTIFSPSPLALFHKEDPLSPS